MQTRSDELVGQWRSERFTQQPLGLARVTASRAVFSQTAPGERHAARLAGLGGRPGIEVIDGGVISPGSDVRTLAAQLKLAGAQAVEIGFGNYGCELEVATLSKELGVPVLLFAPNDGPPNADGTRETDAWCGFQPASKLMADFGVFHYDYVGQSQPSSAKELMKFDQFVCAARAVRSMTGPTRIGQIGGNQPTFQAIGCSPEVLGSRFGVEVVDVDQVELFDRIVALEETEQAMLEAECQAMTERGISLSEIPPENARRIAAAIITELELCCEYRLDGLTHNCWAAVMERHQLMLCMVGGELLRLGVPVACETDKGGLLSMMMLQAFNPGGPPPMFADITITVILEGGKTIGILVWHCGPFSCTNCRDCVARQGWIIPVPKPAYAFLDGVGKFEPGSPMTLARLCNRNGAFGLGFSLVAFEAPVVEGPKTLGTHFYVGLDDATFDELEDGLVLGVDGKWKSTVHHFGVGAGADAHLVEMVARFLGVEADVILPESKEIARRRRGTGLSRLVQA